MLRRLVLAAALLFILGSLALATRATSDEAVIAASPTPEPTISLAEMIRGVEDAQARMSTEQKRLVESSIKLGEAMRGTRHDHATLP